jgi:hypothetical protein
MALTFPLIVKERIERFQGKYEVLFRQKIRENKEIELFR